MHLIRGWFAIHESVTGQLNSVYGSRKIKVMHGKIRSNIAQIHHLVHSYIILYLFIYLQYNWNITSFDYNN